MNFVYNFDGDSIPMWVQLLFWLLYMLIFVYVFRTFISKYKRTKKIKDVTGLFVIYFILFAVFYCINDDYFSYRNWAFARDGRDFRFWSKEQIYVYVILFCRSLSFKYSYEWFRLIVWGGGLLLVLRTAKMYRRLLKPGLTILLLFVLYSSAFCYARASLAMAVFFMGVSIYLWGRYQLDKLLGIALAITSYFFHHELIIGIAALPCLHMHFEKKTTKYLALFLLGFTIGVVTYINSNLSIMEEIFGNVELAEKIEQYNEQEQRVFRLSTFVKYFSLFYPFFIITKLFHRKKRIHKPITGIYRITFALLMATVAFMVVFGLRSVYVYRTMYITIIPMTLMITYFYCHGYFTRKQLWVMMILALLVNSLYFVNSL